MFETISVQTDPLGELQACQYLSHSSGVGESRSNVDVVTESGQFLGPAVLIQHTDISITCVYSHTEWNPWAIGVGMPSSGKELDCPAGGWRCGDPTGTSS